MVDYSVHVARCGYTKIWPSSVWCPVCGKTSIVRRAMPLYLPKPRTKGGDRVVIYVCLACYNNNSKFNYPTVESLMEATNGLRRKEPSENT